MQQLNLFSNTEALTTEQIKLQKVMNFVTSHYKWVRKEPSTMTNEDKMLFVTSCLLTAGTNEMKAVVICEQIKDIWTLSYKELLHLANKVRIPYAPAKCVQIIKTRDIILNNFRKELPQDRAKLEQLPGVARHTASVILATVFDKTEFAVDLHVRRILSRLHLTPAKSQTDLAIERFVTSTIDDQKLGHFSRALVDFGQDICGSKPRCNVCPLDCPSRNTKNKSKLTLKRQFFDVKFIKETTDLNAVFIRQGRLNCTCQTFEKAFKCNHVNYIKLELNQVTC